MSFAWTAPDACPDAASIRARIEDRLGGAADLDDHVIDVTVAREGDDFVARITLDDAERTLDDASCDQLASAVAVIVARLASERRSEPVRAVTPAPAPAQVVAPEAVPWHVGARLSGVTAVGILPGVGVAAEVAVVVERGPASAELAGIDWGERSRMVDAFGTDHLAIGLHAAALRAGWRIGDWPVRVVAGAELGTMTGSSTQAGGGTWFALGGGVAGWWQATARLRIVASAEGDFARNRVRFTLSDGTVEYEPALGSLRGALGVEVGFR